MAAIGVCLLAGFLLRMVDLGAQSLWYDEAFSVYLSRLDILSLTARTAADIHPPLYYYLLHFWLPLAGSGEFAIRYLSLFFGVLTVPILYVLTHRLWGERWPVAPHIVAWLASLSPAYVWYSQEARMYTLTVFLSSFGLYWFVRIAGVGASGRHAGRLAYAFFLVANVAAVYAHFYALFVVAAEALFIVGRWIGQVLIASSRRPSLNSRLAAPVWLILSFAAIGLAYVPWSGYALTRMEADRSYYQGTIDLWPILRDTFTLFAVGHTADVSSAGWGVAALSALAAVGLFAAVYHGGAKKAVSGVGSIALVFLSLAIPIALLYLISYNRPKFHPRYLLLASPTYFVLIGICLAAALGLTVSHGSALRALLFTRGRRVVPAPGESFKEGSPLNLPKTGFHRRWRGNGIGQTVLKGGLGPFILLVSVAVLAAFWTQSLANLYAGGQFGRDDWRGVANYVLDHSQEGDAVILISGHAFPAFTYYYPADNWTPVPDGFTLSTENTLGYNIANTLNHVIEGKERLWVVKWQSDVVDPNGYLDRLLDEGPRRMAVGRAFNGIDVQLYTIPQGLIFSAEPQIANKTSINFDNKLKLLGYELRGDSGGQIAAASGSKIPLTLYWQATTPLDADYVVSIRVKDTEGHYWGRIDRRPANYLYPTQRWKTGEIVFGDYDAPVLAGTPPGSYQLEVEVYTRRDNGLASLNVLNDLGAPAGNASPLAELQVAKSSQLPSVKQLQIAKPHQATFGDLELLGFEEIATGQSLQQGSKVPLMLFWQATRQPSKDVNVVVQLVNGSQTVFYERRMPPARKEYPTTTWSAGELVRAQYDLVIPPDAPAGEAQLRVGLADSTGLIAEPTTIQKVTIAGRQRQTAVPANIQRPMRADLGGVVAFLGYDLDREVVKPGGSVRLTLYWQATTTIERSLAVFTHLLDSQERMWGQKDSIPAGGASPTTGWVPGEVTIDVYDISVKPDTPDGDLTIEIGMYDPATGQRVLVDGRDSRALLGHVRVAR